MQSICAPANVWNHSTCAISFVESTCGSPVFNFNGSSRS
jgi:hypothetical protein